MNCVYCDFKFNFLAANGDIPAIAPVLCESCGEVALLLNGKLRKMSPAELEAVKKSEAWKTIEQFQLAVYRGRKARNAANN